MVVNIWEHQYYSLNKKYLAFAGLWPLQSLSTRLFLQLVMVNGMWICMGLPQTMVFFKNLGNFDTIMQCLPMLSAAYIGLAKMSVFVYHLDKIKLLLSQVQDDWRDIVTESELVIFHDYARRARQMSLFYSVSVLVPVTGYLLMSFGTPILDLIVPLNQSRPRFLIFPGEFYIDTDRHFFIAMPLEWYGLFCVGFLMVTVDSLYMVLVQHSCGMFSLLSNRLERTSLRTTITTTTTTTTTEETWTSLGDADLVSEQEEKMHRHILGCIKLHLRNIEFAKLLESIFTLCFILDIGFGVIGQTGSSVMLVINMGRPLVQLKYGSLALAQCVRILINSYPGQILIDHSSQVCTAAYSSNWYEISQRSKKLLLLLIMRSQTPCKLSVAKMFTMNIESFTLIVKAVMSYCMVMLSIQESNEVAAAT